MISGSAETQCVMLSYPKERISSESEARVKVKPEIVDELVCFDDLDDLKPSHYFFCIPISFFIFLV